MSLSFTESHLGFASKPGELMHVFESMLGQNVNSTSVFGHAHSTAKIKTEKIIMIMIIMIHCESELPPLSQASQGKGTQQ